MSSYLCAHLRAYLAGTCLHARTKVQHACTHEQRPYSNILFTPRAAHAHEHARARVVRKTTRESSKSLHRAGKNIHTHPCVYIFHPHDVMIFLHPYLQVGIPTRGRYIYPGIPTGRTEVVLSVLLVGMCVYIPQFFYPHDFLFWRIRV